MVGEISNLVFREEKSENYLRKGMIFETKTLHTAVIHFYESNVCTNISLNLLHQFLRKV